MNMIRFFSLTFYLLISLFCYTQLHADETPTEGKILGAVLSEKPDWFKESFLEFREDAAEAAEEGKHMLVFADLKGCPYCAKMLQDNFKTNEKDGGNQEYIKANFDSIQIDIKGDREVAF